jgi:hypothetical protein
MRSLRVKRFRVQYRATPVTKQVRITASGINIQAGKA